MDKHLHIICLDVPWPADYGGVVDIFYKLTWLHKLGVKIHLHCFTKGRTPQHELDKYCVSVAYYQRRNIPGALSLKLPYIVSSRNHELLLKNLKKDDYPILMEGIHCTYLLQNGSLQDREVYVRLHNVEFNYYANLAHHERNLFKKLYYKAECFLLKQYEKRIAQKAILWPLSEADLHFYKTVFNASRISHLPAFIPWNEVPEISDKGCFCLYHGNLSVNENEKAAEWLLREVFNDINIPFVVSGKNPSAKLQALAHQHTNTCLVANPSHEEMQDLIRKAQVNILPSFNNTGVKLKLLNALYNGRHCLVNDAAKKGSSLTATYHCAELASEFKQLATELYQSPYTAGNQTDRKEALLGIYDNKKNAQQIINWIY